MKNSIKTATAALIVSGLLSPPIWAKTPVTLQDTNGDGVISAEEIKQLRAAARTAAIAEFDTNGDGELSREERKAMKAGRKAAMITAHDTDGDGKLSREERQAAREARLANAMQQLDVNGDGEVSEEERAGFDSIVAEREERGHRKEKKRGKRQSHYKN